MTPLETLVYLLLLCGVIVIALGVVIFLNLRDEWKEQRDEHPR